VIALHQRGFTVTHINYVTDVDENEICAILRWAFFEPNHTTPDPDGRYQTGWFYRGGKGADMDVEAMRPIHIIEDGRRACAVGRPTSSLAKFERVADYLARDTVTCAHCRKRLDGGPRLDPSRLLA